MHNNPLRVQSVTKQQKRLMGDMEVRNDLFYDKEVFTQILRAENPRSPWHVFGSLLGGQGGAIDNMFEPVTHGVGTEFIKILEETAFQEHARVIDISQVPEVLVAGANFNVGLDRPAADADELLLHRDEETEFMVVGRQPGIRGTLFTLQLVGIPGTSKPGAMFRMNDPIMTGYGNSKGQGSTNSNTFLDDSVKRSTVYNMSQIIRYGWGDTGSSMADEVYKMAVTSAVDGSTTEIAVDIPSKFFRKVVDAVQRALMYSVPNFDPVTKTIANRAAKGRYLERPVFAGMYWWLDQCPWKWYQAKSASLDEGLQKLDTVMKYQYNKTGVKNTIYAMAEGAGLEWLRQVIRQSAMKKYGIQVYQKIEGGDKLKIGFEADQYYNEYGTLVIYDINQAMTAWGEFDRTSFGGIGYRKRSNNIYFIPNTMKTTGGVDKKPAHIYYKEGNGISRGVVFGYQNGINGERGGDSFEKLLAMQEGALKQSMKNERFRLDSTVDGKEYHMLMQIMPYMDTRNVSRLQLF